MKYDYNPFAKEFDDIQLEDMGILTSVAEGWYVEYKQEVPNPASIAKTITAFTNTYGGWAFYGVAEKSKDDPVAGAFPGIANEDADGMLQRIRQSVANHAQPTPYFRVKALHGPAASLGLPADRCIIMCQIPWGPEAPYIHKDGRIYRRVGDGSEPRPENDRYVLDQLWKRSAKITSEYTEWIGRELETSKAEENAAYVRIFLIADFWGDHEPMKSVPLQTVHSIMSDTTGDYAIPFDNIYRTSYGCVARQISTNDPENLGLTWKLGRNFQSEIIIPLSKFRHDNLLELGRWLEGYDHAKRFLKLCYEQRYHSPTIIDLNILLHVLLGITRIQVALAKEFGWTGPVSAKIEISGIWRTIPFFDSTLVLDEYEKHGITLSLQDKSLLYRGDDKESFIELSAPTTDNKLAEHRIMMAVWLFLPIAVALGVPVGFDPDGDGSDISESIMKCLEAGVRAMEVQKNRSELI